MSPSGTNGGGGSCPTPHLGLSRALARRERLDLFCIDELGYVPLAETACELMFQVIADRAEKAVVIVTTNLPYSEWSQVIPNPRLCRALIDRATGRAHIITAGTDSYRDRTAPPIC
jgi:DNA replication protein DnaC